MTADRGSFVALSTLMFLTGIGIPLMATLNGNLGRQLASPAAATAVMFCVGLVLSLICLAFVGLPDLTNIRSVKLPYMLGAGFMVFYALAITFTGPKIGIGNAVFFVLLGQMVSAAAIDHFGLWGALSSAFTLRRAMGLLIMAVGIYFARRTV